MQRQDGQATSPGTLAAPGATKGRKDLPWSLRPWDSWVSDIGSPGWRTNVCCPKPESSWLPAPAALGEEPSTVEGSLHVFHDLSSFAMVLSREVVLPPVSLKRPSVIRGEAGKPGARFVRRSEPVGTPDRPARTRGRRGARAAPWVTSMGSGAAPLRVVGLCGASDGGVLADRCSQLAPKPGKRDFDADFPAGRESLKDWVPRRDHGQDGKLRAGPARALS